MESFTDHSAYLRQVCIKQKFFYTNFSVQHL